MPTFDFYADAGGTTPLTSFVMQPGVNKVAYFLSTDIAKKVQATSDPGVDDIIFSFDDPSPGSGLEATGLKIAATEGALGAAPFDGTLAIGVTLNGGIANGVQIWMTNDSATGTGVNLVCVELVEDAI